MKTVLFINGSPTHLKSFLPSALSHQGWAGEGKDLPMNNELRAFNKRWPPAMMFPGKCLLCSLCSAGGELNSLVFMSRSLVLQGKKGDRTYIKETFAFNELVIIGRGCFPAIRTLLGSLLLWTDKPGRQIWNLGAALIDANGNCVCSQGENPAQCLGIFCRVHGKR